MSYDGLEIDMLSVGDADCILVTGWVGGASEHVLVDGGNPDDYSTLSAFLAGRAVSRLSHVVCSHPHRDHIGGLSGLIADTTIDIGCLWMHRPQQHSDERAMRAVFASQQSREFAQHCQKSLDDASALLQAARARCIPVLEPFAGQVIGPLEVLGPSTSFYESTLGSLEGQVSFSTIEYALLLQEIGFLKEAATGDEADSGLLEDPQTDPINNTSTVLFAEHAGDGFLLTADAGTPALHSVLESYRLPSLRLMQIPHHGSRRNITRELVEHFSPRAAYASAAGNTKHPRRAVVNAFKDVGARVYSTHYPKPGALRQAVGEVPDRPEYSSATPLWEANQ